MDSTHAYSSSSDTKFVPASMGIRFANHIIDYILSLFFCGILELIIVLVSKGNLFGDSNMVIQVFAILFLSRFYYLFFEGIWQSTPGKWITGTKIVRTDGDKPHVGQILGRTLARIIPFEPFSFLTNPNPRGWHDRFSGTVVVSSSATKEDVQSIDYQELKKKKSNKMLYIGILIYIGVIFLLILLSAIFVSMEKAQDTETMSEFSSMNEQTQSWPPQYDGDFSQYPPN